jgi:hypothetical protein
MTRQHLPNRRPSMTIPAMWNGQRFTVTVGFHPDAGMAAA